MAFNNIVLPILKKEYIELIQGLNKYISDYSHDEKKLDIQTLENIYKSDMDQNPYKYFELSVTLLSHAFRNSLWDLYDPIKIKMSLLSQKMTDYNDLVNASYLMKNLIYEVERPFANLQLIDFLNELHKNIKKRMADILSQKYGNDIADDIDTSDLNFLAVVNAMHEVCKEIYEQCRSEIKIQNESFGSTMRKVTDKVTSKIIKYTLADREMSDRLNEKFNRFIGEYKENKKITSYDKIVKDSVNLSQMLKNLFTSSIIALLIPGGIEVKLVGAIITLLIKFAIDKRTELKYKQTILNDLRFELRIVQEKIKDAESKSDNVAKYKLMRTENEIARAIDRITFNLPKN